MEWVKLQKENLNLKMERRMPSTKWVELKIKAWTKILVLKKWRSKNDSPFFHFWREKQDRLQIFNFQFLFTFFWSPSFLFLSWDTMLFSNLQFSDGVLGGFPKLNFVTFCHYHFIEVTWFSALLERKIN